LTNYNAFGKHFNVIVDGVFHSRVPVFVINKEVDFINIAMKFFMIPTTKDINPQYDEERAKELVENVPNIIAIVVTDKGMFPIVNSEVPFGVGPENHIICRTDAGREFALLNSDMLTPTDIKVKKRRN